MDDIGGKEEGWFGDQYYPRDTAQGGKAIDMPPGTLLKDLGHTSRPQSGSGTNHTRVSKTYILREREREQE